MRNLTLCLILLALWPSYGFCIDLKHVHIFKTMNVKIVNDHYEQMLSNLEKQGIDTAILRKNTMSADSDTRNIDTYLSQLDHKPELMIGLATLAAKHLKKISDEQKIPMFFATVSAPIKAGLIDVFGKPTNTMISGVSHAVPMAKTISLAMEMARKMKPSGPIKLGLIMSSYPSEIASGKLITEQIEKNNDLHLSQAHIKYLPNDIEKMTKEYVRQAKKLSPQVDFFMIAIGPTGVLKGFTQALINETKKPVIACFQQQSLLEGCLLKVASNELEVGRLAAEKINQVLKGTQIGKVSPEKVESIRLGLNLREAKRHGVIVPSHILKLSLHNLVK